MPVSATPTCFVANDTSLFAEILGIMMLQLFPNMQFLRQKIPCIKTADQAHKTIAETDTDGTDEVIFVGVFHGCGRGYPRSPIADLVRVH